MRRGRILGVAIPALFAFALTGCGSDDGPVRPPSPPADPYTAANSPGAAFTRFAETYADENVDAYGATLTADFRYVFSSQSDPALVAQYGNTWDWDHETTSAGNLFEGFTDGHGAYQPAADQIALVPSQAVVLEDPTHPDSTRHYAKISLPDCNITIELENQNAFEVSSPFDVYVVRGDAAVLGVGQSADTTHWYVRRIDDLTPAISAAIAQRSLLKPSQAATWGRIRASYLE